MNARPATETTTTIARPRAGRGAKPSRPSLPAPRPARKKQATASAYQRLRDLIVSGRLAPGAPLVESQLSQRLGVSRTPVRAALQRLQQEGFVSASRAGTMLRSTVAPLTAADMREVFWMVGALEAAAARLAAGAEPARRDAVAGALQRLSDALRDAVSSRPPDLARARDLHARFHRACGAGAGPRLLAELDLLQPQAERYERAYASAVVQAPDETAREHDAIVAAIGRGDQEAAERVVTRHWRESADRYGYVMTVLGERGNW